MARMTYDKNGKFVSGVLTYTTRGIPHIEIENDAYKKESEHKKQIDKLRKKLESKNE